MWPVIFILVIMDKSDVELTLKIYLDVKKSNFSSSDTGLQTTSLHHIVLPIFQLQKSKLNFEIQISTKTIFITQYIITT